MQSNFRNHIAFNLIFWLIYFLYEWLGLAALSWQFNTYFINACMALPLSFVVSYATVHVLIKRYYLKSKKLKFWIFQISSSIILLLIRRCFNYFFIYPHFYPSAADLPLFYFPKLLIELVNLYLIVGVYALFYFVQYWYEQKQIVQILLQEKTTAELELLKSQVQPHFIFNTLNNIYATAFAKSPETAGLIAHLSNFLNYNLYESKQETVSLSSEISYIKHYIALQKNRYGDKLDASINMYDAIDELSIAPLLLLPLVENCFKHGVANSIGKSWIRIDLSKQKDEFTIKIENSIEEKDRSTLPKSSGIGLKNVKKRLQLLYPDRHELKIIEETYSFLVTLKIKICKQ
ncbi:MAG: histidine kinase [Parafilimonas sp.]